MNAIRNTEHRTRESLACQVLVVGAGVAGVPAAIAAARAGADTLLVEQTGFPGGTGVTGLHRHICGLYPGEAPGEPTDPDLTPEWLNAGLVRDVCDRLRVRAPDRKPIRLGRVRLLPYATADFRAVFAEMLGMEKQLRPSFEDAVRGIRLESGRIVSVMTDRHEIRPRVVVDCSGAGVVIQASPLLHEPVAANGQLAGYVIRLTGLDTGDDLLPIKVPYAIRRAVEEGTLPGTLRFATFTPGDSRDEGWCKLSLPAGTGGAQALAEARQLHACLREALPAFRVSRLVEHTPEVLEREGIRLKGLYTLTEEDVLTSRRFPDGVARSGWPIELWDPQRGPTFRYPPPGTACDIPLRCLKAAGARNLFCAGRCISATHEALGATRVMGSCMALGEAAGRAAAEMAAVNSET